MKRMQGGYVLVTVLALLVLMTVVASRLDERVGLFRESQGDWARWAEARVALLEAREEALLVMCTRLLTPLGFGVGIETLRVDGRPYRLPSGVRVSMQDMRGLISIATPDPAVLRNFMVRHGVTDAEVEPLIDKLADYGDLDDLKRLNGAEKEGYRALGLPAPRNDWPISPYELRQVAGWHERPSLWRRAGDFFTASRESEINPNTAPREVLLALPGATEVGVAALLARREALAFESVAEVAAVSGIRLAPDHMNFHPGLFFRLRVWHERDGPGALEYTVMFTPAAPRLPWQILEARIVDRPVFPADATIALFPLVSSADGIAAADR